MARVTFPTRLGDCALSWNENGLTAFRLPGDSELSAQQSAAPGEGEPANTEAAPEWVGQTIAQVQRHLEGTPQDFSRTPIDWSRVASFQQNVFLETQRIRAGQTCSYGEIARKLGLGPEGARAVGAALGSNPWPLIVPCHRVVSASGKMTGFSGPGGIRTKVRLLALEGAELFGE
jgi:methylated-DNA-[protein]-cysteine S-methyltransferase